MLFIIPWSGLPSRGGPQYRAGPAFYLCLSHGDLGNRHCHDTQPVRRFILLLQPQHPHLLVHPHPVSVTSVPKERLREIPGTAGCAVTFPAGDGQCRYHDAECVAAIPTPGYRDYHHPPDGYHVCWFLLIGFGQDSSRSCRFNYGIKIWPVSSGRLSVVLCEGLHRGSVRSAVTVHCPAIWSAFSK